MMNGHSHNVTARSAKGPLDAQALDASGIGAADEVFKKFSAASGAKLTWADWIMLRGIIAAQVAGTMQALQEHLLGCTSVWAAMLAPQDQAPLLDALNAEISRLAADIPEDHDRIATLILVRDKVATSAATAQA